MVKIFFLNSHPGLFGPFGLKFPGIKLAVSGFISSGLCGPIEDMDTLLLSIFNPETITKICYLLKILITKKLIHLAEKSKSELFFFLT